MILEYMKNYNVLFHPLIFYYLSSKHNGMVCTDIATTLNKMLTLWQHSKEKKMCLCINDSYDNSNMCLAPIDIKSMPNSAYRLLRKHSSEYGGDI